MTTNIKYFNQFNKDNSNLVIILSKLNDLNSIKLPFDTKIFKNKNFINCLNKDKYAEISIESENFGVIFIVKILLISLKKTLSIYSGADLYGKFNKSTDNNLSFIFSKNLFNSNDLICSNFVFGFLLRSYHFSKYKNKLSFYNPETINIFSYRNKKLKNFDKLSKLLFSINFCKDLVSEPANVLNPITYANKCMKLKKYGLKIKIFNLSQLKKIGMGSLIPVSDGSKNDPRVVLFEWKVNKNSKPTVLVGKGVTFDTGGISLKPSNGMEEMIFDMAGSAVVVGSMLNIALNKINKPVVGIIGLVENMPDGNAQRPGDIVKSLSGKTIEVLNTDAEGRLVLADLLTYIQMNYKPKEIIDFATLTGAIMIALGTHKAGLFSNNNNLSKKLEEAGNISGENIWKLPLGSEYDKEIDSNRADIKNIGSSRYGGSIHAAQFLQRFIENKVPWAHLDIAGVTWSNTNQKNGFAELHSSGATAFGVRLIDQFFKRR